MLACAIFEDVLQHFVHHQMVVVLRSCVQWMIVALQPLHCALGLVLQQLLHGRQIPIGAGFVQSQTVRVRPLENGHWRLLWWRHR